MMLSLANETGIAPTHSIKKLKSIFAEKAGETLPPSLPPPPSPKSREPPKVHPVCIMLLNSVHCFNLLP